MTYTVQAGGRQGQFQQLPLLREARRKPLALQRLGEFGNLQRQFALFAPVAVRHFHLDGQSCDPVPQLRPPGGQGVGINLVGQPQVQQLVLLLSELAELALQ